MATKKKAAKEQSYKEFGWDAEHKVFTWPEFNSDKDRIKAYSMRYKELGIADSFRSVYTGVKIGKNFSDAVNQVPGELSVGAILKLPVLSISKGNVVFDVLNYKTNIYSSVNLHKYARFQKNLPLEPVTVQVKSINQDRVTVDPITPLVNEWLEPLVKTPVSQKLIKAPIVTKVKNLRLTRGGFMGDAVIPNVSDFVGEDFTIPAFIPGSQIVLNITDDFEQFVGKTVDTFILNYLEKTTKDGTTWSLICSAKEYIKFQGEVDMIKMFDAWCEDSEVWQETKNCKFEGAVTGIINSSKKCGVFVEIPELKTTGMVATKPEELVNYKPGDNVSVMIEGFEEEMYYNQFANQMQHVEPYEIENGVLKKCSLKPILKFA